VWAAKPGRVQRDPGEYRLRSGAPLARDRKPERFRLKQSGSDWARRGRSGSDQTPPLLQEDQRRIGRPDVPLQMTQDDAAPISRRFTQPVWFTKLGGLRERQVKNNQKRDRFRPGYLLWLPSRALNFGSFFSFSRSRRLLGGRTVTRVLLHGCSLGLVPFSAGLKCLRNAWLSYRRRLSFFGRAWI
jgi:hypothetical protein